MSEKVRIMIVDDHPVVRDGLLAMLTTQPDFDVVGLASDGDEALLKASKFNPKVILLDLEMPGMDGVEVIKQLGKTHPEINAIVFTAFDTDDRIVTAIRAGAKGYLLKGVPRDELFHAIRVASKGGSLLQPLIASKLIRQMNNRADLPAAPFETLTAREMDVLELLARGKTNKEIAGDLFITERTVKFHVSSILNKFGAGNRTEAVTLAAHQGLIDL
jgi:DNA-binding NarL/FixJ family response regulator